MRYSRSHNRTNNDVTRGLVDTLRELAGRRSRTAYALAVSTIIFSFLLLFASSSVVRGGLGTALPSGPIVQSSFFAPLFRDSISSGHLRCSVPLSREVSLFDQRLLPSRVAEGWRSGTARPLVAGIVPSLQYHLSKSQTASSVVAHRLWDCFVARSALGLLRRTIGIGIAHWYCSTSSTPEVMVVLGERGQPSPVDYQWSSAMVSVGLGSGLRLHTSCLFARRGYPGVTDHVPIAVQVQCPTYRLPCSHGLTFRRFNGPQAP